ncbi:adenosylcobinamide-GDP ribazoletransferase [Fodinicola feengrottensis]|nr:adenosylcobinamide-GDP ribazoletransferase [Fodinicola feengrottensis]
MRAIVLATVTGRLAVVMACARHVPSARPDGFGALVAAGLSRLTGWGWSVLTLGLAWLVANATGGFREAILDVCAVLAGLVAAVVLRTIAVRRFGGVTGDVFGSLLETATTTVLVVLALGG